MCHVVFKSQNELAYSNVMPAPRLLICSQNPSSWSDFQAKSCLFSQKAATTNDQQHFLAKTYSLKNLQTCFCEFFDPSNYILCIKTDKQRAKFWSLWPWVWDFYLLCKSHLYQHNTVSYLFFSGVCRSGCVLYMFCSLPLGPSALHPHSNTRHVGTLLGSEAALLGKGDHTLAVSHQHLPGPSHLCLLVPSLPQEINRYSLSQAFTRWRTRVPDRDLNQTGHVTHGSL